jgi:bifunctional non-homologous end joining protein LigD
MLLTAGPPQTGAGWINEIKLDGARALARVAGGTVTIQSRAGNAFTARFPELATALAARVDGHSVIVDGEIVALDGDGMPSFARLQRRLVTQRPSMVQQRTLPSRLWLFDCLHLDGEDLTALPYRTRREILQDLLPGRAGAVAVAPAWSDIDGPTLAEIATELGVEGTVSKRADSRYLPGRRTRSWIKSPLRHRITVWIIGYASGRSTPVGALLLAGHDPDTGALTYCGSVAAGLGPRISRALHEVFGEYRAATPPWSAHPDDADATNGSRLVWLRPGCSAAIEYRQFTAAGRFRHLAFKGLVEPADWVPLPHRG